VKFQKKIYRYHWKIIISFYWQIWKNTASTGFAGAKSGIRLRSFTYEKPPGMQLLNRSGNNIRIAENLADKGFAVISAVKFMIFAGSYCYFSQL